MKDTVRDALLISIVLVFVVGVWVTMSAGEAQEYEFWSGKHVTVWQCMFSDYHDFERAENQ